MQKLVQGTCRFGLDRLYWICFLSHYISIMLIARGWKANMLKIIEAIQQNTIKICSAILDQGGPLKQTVNFKQFDTSTLINCKFRN